jgi:hypothetical protein
MYCMYHWNVYVVIEFIVFDSISDTGKHRYIHLQVQKAGLSKHPSATVPQKRKQDVPSKKHAPWNSVIAACEAKVYRKQISENFPNITKYSKIFQLFFNFGKFQEICQL